jgi:hypothetical protein
MAKLKNKRKGRSSRCSVCNSPNVKKIERDLLMKGLTIDSVREKYGFKSTSPITTHMSYHVPEQTAKELMGKIPASLTAPQINPGKEIPPLKDFIGCITYLHTGALKVYNKAFEDEDGKLMLMASQEDRKCLELYLRASELKMFYQGQSSWQKAYPLILKAVSEFPEAQLAVAKALKEMKQGAY